MRHEMEITEWMPVMVQIQTCDCKRDRICVRFPRGEIKYLIISFFNSGVEVRSVSYATQHAMPSERAFI